MHVMRRGVETTTAEILFIDLTLTTYTNANRMSHLSNSKADFLDTSVFHTILKAIYLL